MFLYFAEQGFSWQKKLEEVGKKQTISDVKTETLEGGEVTSRKDVMLWNAPNDVAGQGPAGSDDLHIVSQQHRRVTSAFHSLVHPAVIIQLDTDDDVPSLEGDLVVRGPVVLEGMVPLPASPAALRCLETKAAGSL